MIVKEHRIELDDNTHCILRTPETEEAGKLAAFITDVYTESPYMVNTEDEIAADAESYEKMIREIRSSDDSIQAAVFEGERIIASAGILPVGRTSRIRHRCTLGVAVRKEFRNRNLGRYLAEIFTEIAEVMGYYQIEAAVSVKNYEALKMLGSLGFQITGCIPDAIRTDEGYTDELYLVKKLIKTDSGNDRCF